MLYLRMKKEYFKSLNKLFRQKRDLDRQFEIYFFFTQYWIFRQLEKHWEKWHGLYFWIYSSLHTNIYII